MFNNQPHRVLVVEDDSEFRHSLRRILAKAGYATFTADNGLAADALLKKGSFHLVLLDLHLTGKSGMTLLKELKNSAPETRVIVMGVESDFETNAEVMRNGAFAYISKPFKIKQLFSYLDKALVKAGVKAVS